MDSKVTKILFIEDNPGDIRLISEMLAEIKTENFALEQVGRLSEGQEYLSSKDMDIVLLDLTLPDSSGLETFNRLNSKVSDIPIIVLSGLADETISIKAVQTGAQDYLIKGQIDSNILRRAIRYAIERNKVEQDVRRSQEYIKCVIESSIDMIITSDIDRKIVEFNREAEREFGYDRKEVIGKSVDILYAEPAKGLAVYKTTIEKGQCTREIYNRRKNGDIFQSFISASLLYDTKGEKIGIVGISRDITKDKRSQKEKEKLRQQLVYAENMASLGKLAGGVAHEINNPLTSVLSTAELLFEDLEEDSVCKEDIKQIIMESKRIKDTVKSFLGFARTREFVFKPTNVNKLIESILRVIGRGKLEKVRLIKNYDESIGEIKLSWFHIEEVFINIITNALHSMNDNSMNDKGTLMITTGQQENNIFVSIKDSGSGIEKENIDKIFEPYFTTKDKKGTGLGLSTSKIIVVQHGGEIKIKSDGKSKGSEFIIYLPKE